MKKAGNSRQKNNNQPIYVFTKRDAIQASRFVWIASGRSGNRRRSISSYQSSKDQKNHFQVFL